MEGLASPGASPEAEAQPDRGHASEGVAEGVPCRPVIGTDEAVVEVAAWLTAVGDGSASGDGVSDGAPPLATVKVDSIYDDRRQYNGAQVHVTAFNLESGYTCRALTDEWEVDLPPACVSFNFPRDLLRERLVLVESSVLARHLCNVLMRQGKAPSAWLPYIQGREQRRTLAEFVAGADCPMYVRRALLRGVLEGPGLTDTAANLRSTLDHDLQNFKFNWKMTFTGGALPDGGKCAVCRKKQFKAYCVGCCNAGFALCAACAKGTHCRFGGVDHAEVTMLIPEWCPEGTAKVRLLLAASAGDLPTLKELQKDPGFVPAEGGIDLATVVDTKFGFHALLWAIRAAARAAAARDLELGTRAESVVAFLLENSTKLGEPMNWPMNFGATKHELTVDEGSSQGITPLICAAHFGCTDIVRLLLKHGAKIDLQKQCDSVGPAAKGRQPSGATALFAAAEQGHLEVLEVLIAAGAATRPIVTTNHGVSPLYTARAWGNTECTVALVRAGADLAVMPKNTIKGTAIKVATTWNDVTEAAVRAAQCRQLSVELFPHYATAVEGDGSGKHWVSTGMRGWVFAAATISGTGPWDMWKRDFAKSVIGRGEDLSEAEDARFNRRWSWFARSTKAGRRVVLRTGGDDAIEVVSDPAGYFTGDISLRQQQLLLPEPEPEPEPEPGLEPQLEPQLAPEPEPQPSHVQDGVTGPEPKPESPAPGKLFLVPPEGLSIISDIDDTVKISNALSKSDELLKNTFYREWQPVPGMADMYRSWMAAQPPASAALHFVSSSPWQLGPELVAFLHGPCCKFPPATYHLKTVNINGASFLDKDKGLAAALTSGHIFKPPEISKIIKDFPRREFWLVGDSGEKDPEAYAEVYKAFPTQVKRIYIRKVTATSTDEGKRAKEEAKLVDRHRPQRFSDAFEGVPDDVWRPYVFSDPATMMATVADAMEPEPEPEPNTASTASTIVVPVWATKVMDQEVGVMSIADIVPTPTENDHEPASAEEAEPPELDAWLAQACLAQYAAQVKEYGYDTLKALQAATEADIVEMTADSQVGMKKPHRRLFLEQWKGLLATGTSSTGPESAATTAQSKFAAFFLRMGIAAAIQGLDATPISSLREAVSFIVGEGTPSQDLLIVGCQAAIERAGELLAAGPDEHGLTLDEIAAIHLYTQELMYRALNRALWSQKRGAVKPYWGFIRLLQHALFKVPKCEAGAIYRGIKDPYEPITEAAMLALATESGGSGEPVIWWGFSSCSTNQQPVMNFLGQDPATVRVLYTIEGGSSARDVRKYSEFQEESEVLMPFGSAFTVVTASAPSPNLLLVTLRQTQEFVYGDGGGGGGGGA